MPTVPYQAPDFSVADETGQSQSLKDYAGSWLVLYFYPKDDTPGCTTEACSLRDARDEIAALGAQIVGVSKDEPASHESFKAKHSLNFHLLADPSGEMIERYGAWGKKMFGKEGILRKTFIITPDAQVVKVFGRVTPLGHGEQVIAELKRLQAKSHKF
jgi:peroxiredoxin Q/BCP